MVICRCQGLSRICHPCLQALLFHKGPDDVIMKNTYLSPGRLYQGNSTEGLFVSADSTPIAQNGTPRALTISSKQGFGYFTNLSFLKIDIIKV